MIDQPQDPAVSLDLYRVDPGRVAEAILCKMNLLKVGREAIQATEADRISKPPGALH